MNDQAPFTSEQIAEQLSRLIGSILASQLPLLLTADQVAEQLGVSRREVSRMDRAGLLPQPARLGRKVRWPSAELAAWVAAGCQDRETWAMLKAQERGRSVRG